MDVRSGGEAAPLAPTADTASVEPGGGPTTSSDWVQATVATATAAKTSHFICCFITAESALSLALLARGTERDLDLSIRFDSHRVSAYYRAGPAGIRGRPQFDPLRGAPTGQPDADHGLRLIMTRRHSQISIALDTYSHLLPATQRDAMDGLICLLSTGG